MGAKRFGTKTPVKKMVADGLATRASTNGQQARAITPEPKKGLLRYAKSTGAKSIGRRTATSRLAEHGAVALARTNGHQNKPSASGQKTKRHLCVQSMGAKRFGGAIAGIAANAPQKARVNFAKPTQDRDTLASFGGAPLNATHLRRYAR